MDSFTLRGRVLYLTADLALVRAQLEGHDLAFDRERPLLDKISTDEITPAWTCYFFDETLGRYCLVGLRGGGVSVDAIKKGRFDVLVVGASKGCGSSRETAPFAELCAGIRLVVATSFEKIYRQNCQNIGLLTTTDLGAVPRLLAGESIGVEKLTGGLDPISASIVEQGSLFAYARARLRGDAQVPPLTTATRPMTVAEKMIAAHVVVDSELDLVGVPAVAPGDAAFVRADVRFSHDYVTAMARALFTRGFGESARITDPSSVYMFRDHLTLLDRVMPTKQRRLGLLDRARLLGEVQETFADEQRVRLYDDGYGICHNVLTEEIARPGQLIVGTDSHTCTAGASGAFAFGVGATDMAVAWVTRDVRLRVPETVRVDLRGTLASNCCAKDVVLYLLSLPLVRDGGAIGKVLEIGGPGVAALSLDELATIANMAVEAGAMTAVFEGETVPDERAAYDARITIDLDAIEPMVALPGDPRNGRPLGSVGRVKIDIAYGGSCTGGKRSDMDMYARVLRDQRVARGVKLYIQFGSAEVRRYAASRSYINIFRAAGAELLEPSCGACIHAGPGISERADQVTVSAINRNFPGRSGPGAVYLASPLVVAASAIAGFLDAPRSQRSARVAVAE